MEVIEGDVRNVHAIKVVTAGVVTVFHLAGRAHALSEIGGDEALHQTINVQGTRNILEGAVAGGAKQFVLFSSVKVLGEGASGCLNESVEPAPVTAYGRSKFEAEQLVLDYSQRLILHASCLRLPLVYGPGNKGNLLQMISAIDRGFFPPLPEVSNRRSMVHVTNVVEAAVLVANYPAANGQCYIVTDGRSYSTCELYEMICKGLGKRIPRWYVPLKSLKALGRIGDFIGLVRGRRFLFDSDALEKLIGSAWYSSEKISRELGYRPSITFEDALPELIAWYRKSQT